MKTVSWVNSSDFPHGSLLGRLADWLEWQWATQICPQQVQGSLLFHSNQTKVWAEGGRTSPQGRLAVGGGELARSSFPWFHLSKFLSRAGLRFLRPGDFPAPACFSHCPA